MRNSCHVWCIILLHSNITYPLHRFQVPANSAAVANMARLCTHTDHIDVLQKRHIYGPNEIAVPFQPLRVLIEQLLNPFYVFQAMSIFLWIMWEYYSYTVVIALLSLLSLAIEFFELASHARKLRSMAQNAPHVLCYRNGTEGTLLPSSDLIPGDVIEITNASVVPCDVLLLNGSCVVDESTLSGGNSLTHFLSSQMNATI